MPALDDNERFGVVWNVLRALRSHDDRLDAEINRIDLNDTPTGRIIFSGGDGDGVSAGPELPFAPIDLPPGAIFARIVDKCGDRKYWETWARDVADIFTRLVHRIEHLLAASGNETLREWFGAFHEELKVSINASIDRGDAIEIMTQHVLTRPVFEALFEHYDFAAANPVARALDALRRDFGEFGLENEVRDLERFYESVRMRARGLDNSAARQRVLMEALREVLRDRAQEGHRTPRHRLHPVEIVDSSGEPQISDGQHLSHARRGESRNLRAGHVGTGTHRQRHGHRLARLPRPLRRRLHQQGRRLRLHLRSPSCPRLARTLRRRSGQRAAARAVRRAVERFLRIVCVSTTTARIVQGRRDSR